MQKRAVFWPLHCPAIWRFCCSRTFSWLVGDWRSVFGKPSPQCWLVQKSGPVYSTGRAWILKLTANKQPSRPSGFQLNANDIQSTVTVSSSRVNEVFVCQANERIPSTGGRCAGLNGWKMPPDFRGNPPVVTQSYCKWNHSYKIMVQRTLFEDFGFEWSRSHTNQMILGGTKQSLAHFESNSSESQQL